MGFLNILKTLGCCDFDTVWLLKMLLSGGQDFRNLQACIPKRNLYGLSVFIEDALIGNKENKMPQGKEILILYYILMQ